MRNRKALVAVGCLLALLVALCPLLAATARADEALGDEYALEGATVVAGDEGDVEFVYVDAEQVSVGEEQNVAVGFSRDVEESMVRLQNIADDSVTDLAQTSGASGAALFRATFDSPAVYRVIGVYYRLAGDDASVWRLHAIDSEQGGGFVVSARASGDDGVSLLSDGSGAGVTFSTLSDDGSLVESGSLGDVMGLASSRARFEGTCVVVVDPGHGGSDAGASGNGLVEKNLTLAIARYCRDALEAADGFEVVMTRTGDTYVGLVERAEIARDAGADFFVSIHINALGTGTAYGAEVYIPNDSSWHYEFHELGETVGEGILSRLEALGLYDRGTKFGDYPDSDKTNDDGTPVDEYVDGSPADEFSVIRNCRRFGIPAILVENGFIDNAHDSALLAQDSFLKSLGTAIADAIIESVEPLDGPLYGFSDVFEDTSHSQEIGWLAASGVTTGSRAADGSLEFRGTDSVTRGQMAAFLYRLAGSPSYAPSASDRARFSDVTPSTQFAKEVWWLASTGIASGYGDGRYGIGDTVLRGDMAVFLRRFVERFIDPSVSSWTPGAADRAAFSDVDSTVSQREYIWWLASEGIAGGYGDGRYGCDDPVIRQDMAAFLCRIGNLPSFEPTDAQVAMFADVDEDTPAANDIWWLVASGITTGSRTEDGSLVFRGDSAVTRGQMAAFLYRLAGSPSYAPSASDRARFSDVTPFTQFAKEVWWLASTGITTGYGDGRFGVGDTVSRADMAVFLRRFYDLFATGDRYAGWSPSSLVSQRFSDVSSSSSQAESIWWLAATGISNGYADGTYAPTAAITRADMASFLRGLSIRMGRMTGAAPKAEGIEVPPSSGSDEGPGDADLSGGSSDQLPELAEDYSIMGASTATASQLVSLFKSTGKAFPSETYASRGAATIEEFVAIVMEEAAAEGVRADIVFAQSMKETGWLQFGGQVSADQCNFAGIGAVNGGAAGASFEDVRTGVRAQVQHLKAYASTEDLVNPCVDPRFHLVKRGVAPMLTDLNGRWAVPGTTYGQEVFALIQRACSL